LAFTVYISADLLHLLSITAQNALNNNSLAMFFVDFYRAMLC